MKQPTVPWDVKLGKRNFFNSSDFYKIPTIHAASFEPWLSVRPSDIIKYSTFEITIRELFLHHFSSFGRNVNLKNSEYFQIKCF